MPCRTAILSATSSEIADIPAQRFIHIGDEGSHFAPMGRTDGHHLAGQFNGAVQIFHEGTVPHGHIQQDGV